MMVTSDPLLRRGDPTDERLEYRRLLIAEIQRNQTKHFDRFAVPDSERRGFELRCNSHPGVTAGVTAAAPAGRRPESVGGFVPPAF